MKLRHRLKRWLGIVSPSGAYPLPPRWALSKVGRDRWYPQQGVTVSGDRSVAAGGHIGFVSTGDRWYYTHEQRITWGQQGRACACGQLCVCGPVGAGPALPRNQSTSGRQEGAQGC